MAELPTTIDPVWDKLENYTVPRTLSPYLGYSQIGHKCGRYLWYSFRWAFTEEITPRMRRLFSRGDQEEAVVVADLRRAGIECSGVLNEQIEVVGVMGHIKGRPDGRCIGVPGAERTEHNLEIKTANAARFQEFKKFGVERANPQYWVQTQCYMKRQELTRSLFIVTNKNTDERFYQRIPFEPDVAQEAEERGFDIITSTTPPKRLSDRPEWYECKFCAAKGVCHGNATLERNCRTCAESSIKDDGEWHCRVYSGSPIPEDFQRTGCADHHRCLL